MLPRTAEEVKKRWLDKTISDTAIQDFSEIHSACDPGRETPHSFPPSKKTPQPHSRSPAASQSCQTLALGRIFSMGRGLEAENCFAECDVGTALWSCQKAAEPGGACGSGGEEVSEGFPQPASIARASHRMIWGQFGDPRDMVWNTVVGWLDWPPRHPLPDAFSQQGSRNNVLRTWKWNNSRLKSEPRPKEWTGSYYLGRKTVTQQASW